MFHGCDEQFAYNISERLIFAYLSAIMASFPFFWGEGGGGGLESLKLFLKGENCK